MNSVVQPCVAFHKFALIFLKKANGNCTFCTHYYTAIANARYFATILQNML